MLQSQPLLTGIRQAEEQLAQSDASAARLYRSDVGGTDVYGRWLDRTAVAARHSYDVAGDLTVRAVSQSAAVVVGTAVDGASGRTIRFLHVWAYSDGQWQLCVFHDTAVAADGSRRALELLLVPFLVSVGLLMVVADGKKEHAQTARVLRVAQGIVGGAMALFVAYQTLTHFADIANIGTVKELALPIALSVLFVPFLYLMALYVAYDGIFRRLGWAVSDRPVRRYARRRTVALCGLSLGTLAEWSRVFGRTKFDTRVSVDSAVADFRATTKSGLTSA